MPIYNVTIEAQGPLLLGSGLSLDNVQSSRHFIAGSVWRGAIARTILDDLGLRANENSAPVADLPESFQQVFLPASSQAKQAMRFGFLYPVRERQADCIGNHALPLPLTAHTCKQADGFPDRGHGVFDSLRNRIRTLIPNPEEHNSHRLLQCPICGGRLERLRGYIYQQPAKATADIAATYSRVKLGTRSFVHVGLNRYTETAQEQILFVQDSLTPGSGKTAGVEKPLSFVGQLYGSTAQYELLQELLETHFIPAQADGSYELRIGSARSRGMGNATLTLSGPVPAVSLAAQVDAFQPRGSAGPLDPNHLYAALTLHAPLQLLDRIGETVMVPTVETLRAYSRLVPMGLTVCNEATIVEAETWTGWSGAWRLPKPIQSAVAAGSVIVVRVPRAEQTQLLDFLEEIAENGLGERCAEGWGELHLCDPFHIIFDEADAMTQGAEHNGKQ